MPFLRASRKDFIISPCPSSSQRLTGQTGWSPRDQTPTAPLLELGGVNREKEKGLKSHEFAVIFISKQDSGPSVDLRCSFGLILVLGVGRLLER